MVVAMLKRTLNNKISTPQEVSLYVAERLKITRKQKHISLQDLAQNLGISRKQLQNYESGKSNITLVRLWQIASLLRTDILFLIEGLSQNKKTVSNEDLRFIYKLHHLPSKTAEQAFIGLLNDF